MTWDGLLLAKNWRKASLVRELHVANWREEVCTFLAGVGGKVSAQVVWELFVF